ncbi:hypothetical protein BH20ACI4_BH20ACI4_03770 [soil metagenome]
MKNETESLSMDFYKEICSNIRASDDISFKLLNIVPVMSGIGSTALVFLEKSGLLSNYSSYAVISLSICGALITIGLFKWELRNIQKCNWLIQCAEDFELKVLKNAGNQLEKIQYADYKNDKTKTSPITKMPWGKTQAERLIYIVAIVVWFVPITIGLYKILNPLVIGFHKILNP